VIIKNNTGRDHLYEERTSKREKKKRKGERKEGRGGRGLYECIFLGLAEKYIRNWGERMGTVLTKQGGITIVSRDEGKGEGRKKERKIAMPIVFRKTCKYEPNNKRIEL